MSEREDRILRIMHEAGGHNSETCELCTDERDAALREVRRDVADARAIGTGYASHGYSMGVAWYKGKIQG